MIERAIGYCRVSSEEQADNNSLATQERDIRAYCKDRGYQLVGLYREVYTGTLLEARPELRRLRADAEAKRLDVAVVWHSDRLSRDPDDRVYLRVEANRRGARYESVTDPLGGTDEDRLVQYIQGYAAKQEVRRITERSVANSRARMKSGKLPGGGKPRYGYMWPEDERRVGGKKD
jgi:site-specific DNA recombinase